MTVQTIRSAAEAPIGPVLLVNFIGTLGYTIAIPFLVFLVTRLGGDAVVYGFVAATYSAFQFIGAPILGRWSDRFGRRRILLLSQTGTFISWLIFGAALYLPNTMSLRIGAIGLSLPLLVIVFARALDGLTGGNISVANAYVADISTEQTRARNFGRMGVASNLGMVLGPALASVLGATLFGEALPIFGAALISLVGVALIVLRLPESKPQASPHPARKDAARSMCQEARDCVHAAGTHPTSAGKLLRVPRIGFVVALNFVIMAAFSFFYTAFPINAATRLGWSAAEMGVYFAILSLMLVIVQGPVLEQLSKRFRDHRLISSGLLLLAINFALLHSEQLVVLYLAAGLFAVGNGIMWPTVVAVVAKVAGSELQGAVQGVAGSAGSLASIFGLALGGFAYNAIGVWTFQLSTLLTLIAFAMALALPRFVPDTPPQADLTPHT